MSSNNRNSLIPPVLYSLASIEQQQRRPGRESAGVLTPGADQHHLPDHAFTKEQLIQRGSRTAANIRSLSRITEHSDERSVNSSPVVRAAKLAGPPTVPPLRASHLHRATDYFKPAVKMPEITMTEARELFAEFGIDRPSG